MSAGVAHHKGETDFWTSPKWAFLPNLEGFQPASATDHRYLGWPQRYQHDDSEQYNGFGNLIDVLSREDQFTEEAPRDKQEWRWTDADDENPEIEPTVPESIRWQHKFNFRGPQEVIELVDSHQSLISLLWETREQVDRHFGPSSEIVLEVVDDPEIEDYLQLFAFIQTDLPPAEALDKLKKLDRAWGLEALRRSGGILCIYLEYP